MGEQEREIVREGDQGPDVEGHIKRRSEDAEPPEGEAGMRREVDEEPDVEGHIKR